MNIRSLLIVLSIGFFSVGAPAANANEAQQNAGQIYAELQAANCKLHNDATPFNVTLENIQLMVLCRKSNPSFQKKIKPLHVDMALMKEDYNDVIIALRKVGVYIN